MVTVTADNLRRVEQVEQELASAGREAERASLHKAVIALRRQAIERLERQTGAAGLPPGRLPAPDEPPLRTIAPAQAQRLAALQAAHDARTLTADERRELASLLDHAEAGAMRNVLALVREHAPNSEAYARALRAYKRSFAPLALQIAGSPSSCITGRSVVPHPLHHVVARRARGRCEYCMTPERLAGYEFEVEHVIPSTRGGPDTLDNLALACGPCNKIKGVRQRARDPATGKLVSLFDPRRDPWDAHFSWRDDYTVIEGRTPVGRATVAAIRLNTTRRRDARALWRALAALNLGDPPFRWP